MSKLAAQKQHLLDNGFTEEKANAFIKLKEVTNEELDKCIKTLGTLKTILADHKYKQVESAFNQVYKKFDGAKYDLAYETLENKINMYSNYMNEFRISIRSIFNKDIF